MYAGSASWGAGPAALSGESGDRFAVVVCWRKSPEGGCVNLRRMFGALALAMLASALVYAVLAIVGDGPAVAAALSGFPAVRLVAMLALAIGCYLVRGLRCGALMRLAG